MPRPLGSTKYNYDRQAFGKEVRKARERLGLSISSLAMAAGINRGTVSQAEAGMRSLPPATRLALIAALLARENDGSVHGDRLYTLAGMDNPTAPTLPNATPFGPNSPEASLGTTAGDAERLAAAADEGGDWIRAEHLFSIAAHQAAVVGDRATWARNWLSAGQIAAVRGRSGAAESYFRQVYDSHAKPVADGVELGPEAKIEACIRLGILHYDLGALLEGEAYLTQGLARLEAWDGRRSGLSRIKVHQVLPYPVESDSAGARLILLFLARHYLGRLYADRCAAIADRTSAHLAARVALAHLDASARLAHALGIGRGLDELRGALCLRYFDPTAAFRVIEQSEEALTDIMLADSKRAFVQAEWYRDDDPRKAMSCLESAYDSALQPTFAAPMASKVLKAMAELTILQAPPSSSTVKAALRSGLAALAFNPRSRRALEGIAHINDTARMLVGEVTSSNLWLDAEQELWAAQGHPFTDLKRLATALGPDGARAHLEEALARAEDVASKSVNVKQQDSSPSFDHDLGIAWADSRTSDDRRWLRRGFARETQADAARDSFQAAHAQIRPPNFSPPMPELDASTWIEHTPMKGWPHQRHTALTRREIMVVRLVAEGLTNKEIANELFIATETVSRHVSSIFRKLDVRSRTALATYAIRHGLAPSTD